jgi:pimeloyl-ACP methyl ester carboxylesterase
VDPSFDARQALQRAFAEPLARSDNDDGERVAPLLANTPTLPVRLAFLVHGIRDYGEWQTAIADELREIDPMLRVIKVRYGYFSAFQFAVTDLRQQSVRAFRLQYLEEVLGSTTPLRPDQIAAMGHSNGTYAIGQFVRTHPAAKFGRLLLAAPVLPRRFPFDPERTPVVRAECAPDDVPVGVLANGLSWYFFGARTIGDAGFGGFRFPHELDGNNSFRYGNHGQIFRQTGAAGNIARFLAGASDWKAAREPFTWYSRFLQLISFLIAPLLLATFVWWLVMCLTTWGVATLLTGLVAVVATLILIKM